MRVLHINTLNSGGAAQACFRLHKALLKAGISSDVLTLKKVQGYPAERIHSLEETAIFEFWKGRIVREVQKNIKSFYLTKGKISSEKFQLATAFFALQDHPLVQQADIINLHWVSQILDYKNFFTKVSKPIFWTLHDMTPFTGGCDYSFGCQNFKSECQECWFTENSNKAELPQKVLSKKRASLQDKDNLEIITLSNWMKSQSQNSQLFKGYKHHLIPNSLDLNTFKPISQSEARKKLRIALDKKVLLFVADSITDSRKGYSILHQAIQLINNPDLLPIAIGSPKKEKNVNTYINHIGYITDPNELALVYNAADIFVIPSLEDNLPNTILEAQACGVPTIGFPKGGVTEMIPPSVGYLAQEITADGLANTIKKWLLNDSPFDRNHIRKHAVDNYSPTKQATRYIKIYQEALI